MAFRSDTHTAIVILGAGLGDDGVPGPALLRRVSRGARLAEDHSHCLVIVSGGWLRGPRSEASVMVRLLDQQGIAPDRILSEDRSLNTFENILNVRAMLAALEVTDVLLVTDSFHMPRALMTCWWLGVSARGRAAWHPHAEVGAWMFAHLREVAALPYYVYRLSRHSLKEARR